jgi:hypothetical protein
MMAFLEKLTDCFILIPFIYKFSSTEKQAIVTVQTQIKQGDSFTDEEANKAID